MTAHLHGPCAGSEKCGMPGIAWLVCKDDAASNREVSWKGSGYFQVARSVVLP